MRIRVLFLALLSFAFLVDRAPADEKKPNCRLMTQTFFEDSKKLDVEMIHVDNHEACKYEALTREVTTREKDGVKNVVVRFGYSGPMNHYISEPPIKDVMQGTIR